MGFTYQWAEIVQKFCPTFNGRSDCSAYLYDQILAIKACTCHDCTILVYAERQHVEEVPPPNLLQCDHCRGAIYTCHTCCEPITGQGSALLRDSVERDCVHCYWQNRGMQKCYRDGCTWPCTVENGITMQYCGTHKVQWQLANGWDNCTGCQKFSELEEKACSECKPKYDAGMLNCHRCGKLATLVDNYCTECSEHRPRVEFNKPLLTYTSCQNCCKAGLQSWYATWGYCWSCINSNKVQCTHPGCSAPATTQTSLHYEMLTCSALTHQNNKKKNL